ncbi:MAG: ARMT1-like domain-containing protein [Candidatus Poribacteria bacterium]|nr:ARMT1-like domain-containing protein [Candidatus Poribacteria bacterium]MDE0505586.1 ARMT1-like domain-containing protein [Candidatus Poribacteria bacterium]
MHNDLTTLRRTVETILRCNLTTAIGIPDNEEAERRIERFLYSIANRVIEHELAQWLDPQWVILAGGQGTRIDPTGRLNKTLDLWFGESNTLQVSRSYLPGTRPHVIVVNSMMAERLVTREVLLDGVIPSSALDMEAVNRLCGRNAILCVQPEQNGTGGALQTAIPSVRESGAEWIGIAFGDEPFLNQAIYLQTLVSHFINEADVTLCGKIPETVVDKGGMFFDKDGRFVGTKEWNEMTDGEKCEMSRRLGCGEGYTNTGITLIRSSAAIDRINRLQPHGSKSELHHVDLIRYCYEDGLKTHAYIYREEAVSGINRWSNLIVGEEALFARTRVMLAQKGVRVDPAAQITLSNDDIQIGTGCYFLGRIHLGEGVRIGNYCRLENVELSGRTAVGDLVGLKDVTAADTIFESNPLSGEIGSPIAGLGVLSKIENCRFDRVRVGRAVNLSFVKAAATVIPAGMSINNRELGVPNSSNSRIPLFPLDTSSDSTEGASDALSQLVGHQYIAGAYTFGEMRNKPDWENLRRHVRSHSNAELISRATRHPGLRRVVSKAIEDLLEMRKGDDTYITDELTPEEVWGVIFEVVSLATGNPDPYRKDKLKARQTALDLLGQIPDCDWSKRLKLVIAANVIDYSSSRVIGKLAEQPDHFNRVLQEAAYVPLAIDCLEQFQSLVIEDGPKRLVWLVDNDGEAVFDLSLIQMLVHLGHQITIVGKAAPASNDATLTDLEEVINLPPFQDLRSAVNGGEVSLCSSGSKTVGTNLYQATPSFMNVLLDSELVISKGQGNYYTTQGLKRDTFYLLLSKGVTAERFTGVVPDWNKVIDGLILAYVPAGTRLEGTLAEFCGRMRV